MVSGYAVSYTHLEFDDLSKKSENELTPEEEHFLVYKGMKDREEAKTIS